jgi:hypothetical protein
VVQADDQHVARRLQELLGWAEYIVESLATDQRYEQGKVEALRRMIGDAALGELQQTAGALRETLDRAWIRVNGRPLAGLG